MPPDYVVKTTPAVRLTARTATLDPDTVSEHIGPMFDAVADGLRPGSPSCSSP